MSPTSPLLSPHVDEDGIHEMLWDAVTLATQFRNRIERAVRFYCRDAQAQAFRVVAVPQLTGACLAPYMTSKERERERVTQDIVFGEVDRILNHSSHTGLVQVLPGHHLADPSRSSVTVKNIAEETSEPASFKRGAGSTGTAEATGRHLPPSAPAAPPLPRRPPRPAAPRARRWAAMPGARWRWAGDWAAPPPPWSCC